MPETLVFNSAVTLPIAREDFNAIIRLEGFRPYLTDGIFYSVSSGRFNYNN
jgi:hypothetical protein